VLLGGADQGQRLGADAGRLLPARTLLASTR